MSTPAPNDLFLNIWSAWIHSDDDAQPGTPDWTKRRQALHQHWARVWDDVKSLTEYLARADAAIEEIKTVVNDPRPTPPCDPPAREE